jgi:IclR family pca regulon transcriptional regulator
VAAVNVSVQASRMSLEAVRRELLPPLLKTTANIEADIPRSRRSGQESRRRRSASTRGTIADS